MNYGIEVKSTEGEATTAKRLLEKLDYLYLLKGETKGFTEGAVLFWDEPEANINPKHIPTIVDMLLLLQRESVQIFVSTHDYFLAKYFDVCGRILR